MSKTESPVQSILNKGLTFVKENLEKYPAVDKQVTTLSEKVKLDKSILAILIALSPILLIFYEYYLMEIVAFGYPIYGSIQAINEKSTEQTTNWLMYWIVIGFYFIFDSFLEFIFFAYLPFQFFIRLALIVSLYHPSTCYAKEIFTKVSKLIKDNTSKEKEKEKKSE